MNRSKCGRRRGRALEEKKLELSDGNAGAMTRSRPGDLPEVTSEMIEAGVDALICTAANRVGAFAT